MTTYISIVERLESLCRAYRQSAVDDSTFVKQLVNASKQANDTSHYVALRNQQASLDWKQYASDSAMIAWCEAHDCSLPGKRTWVWMRDQRMGEIIGIPGSRGIPRITDGIQCIIELEGGGIFIGHRNWFEADPLSINQNVLARQRRARKARPVKAKPATQLAELFATKREVSAEEILALLK